MVRRFSRYQPADPQAALRCCTVRALSFHATIARWCTGAAGAFVAGVPLQPIVLRYDEVGHTHCTACAALPASMGFS